MTAAFALRASLSIIPFFGARLISRGTPSKINIVPPALLLYRTSPRVPFSAANSHPNTFGELLNQNYFSGTSKIMDQTSLSATFGTGRPPCPCCSFLLNGDLFLPWNEDEESTKDEIKISSTTAAQQSNGQADRLDASTEVMSPLEALRIIHKDGRQYATPILGDGQRVSLVDTHGHPHLEREIQYANESSEGVSSTSITSLQSSVEALDVTTSVVATTAGPSDAAKSGKVSNDLVTDGVVSLTCAVSPNDWDDALKYASQSPWILPALGVHPWYLGDILAQDFAAEEPSSTNDSDDSDDPKELEKYLQWDWLSTLEHHLSQHPHLLVGEIGLCKMARFVREFPKEKGGKATALQLQKIVFRKQLELAAKWKRPVTVHCVNMHGSFMDVLKDILQETKDEVMNDAKSGAESSEGVGQSKSVTNLESRLKNAFPPSIAMHSFTGTAHHVQEILSFEEQILHPNEVESKAGGKRKKKRQQSNNAVKSEDVTNQNKEEGGDRHNSKEKNILFYFGFSHAVNHLMCTSDKARRKGMEALRSIPSDRLLVESDVHASVDVALGTAGAVSYAAFARGEKVEDVAGRCARNGLRFLSSLDSVDVSVDS